jgi:hypothetical protein
MLNWPARWPSMLSFWTLPQRSRRFGVVAQRRHLGRPAGDDFTNAAHRRATRTVARNIAGHLLQAVQHGCVISI